MTEEIKKMQNSEKLIIVLGIIFAVLFIAGAIIIKASVPSYSIGKLIITIVVIILFFGSILTIWHFIEKGKNKGKIQEDLNKKKQPDPINHDEARKMALEATENEIYGEYIRFNVLNEGVEELGKGIKSQVYWLEGEGKYTKKDYFVAINMHFPDKKKCILINPTETQKLRAKMLCSTFPEDEPNIREVTTRNVLTGTEQTIKERKEEKKEEEKKEDNKKEDI